MKIHLHNITVEIIIGSDTTVNDSMVDAFGEDTRISISYNNLKP